MLEIIQRDECLRLLAGDEIGRLAVVAGNTPIVLPVSSVPIDWRTGDHRLWSFAGRGGAMGP